MFYLQGLIMGLAYVAPIGLQNIFIINTALAKGVRQALVTSLIVIFFDVTLAIACFLGIGAIMKHGQWIPMLILFFGSLLVIWIGVNLLLTKKLSTPSTEVNIPIRQTFFRACIVTWFNPQAIIDGTMMLGAFRATLPPSESSIFILGVASASCLWFPGLTLFVTFFSNIFTPQVLKYINRICGSVIIFYGLKLFYTFILLLT